MNNSPPDITRIGGDAAAFEAFYRGHIEAVQRFVARRVGDPHVAADLTADVFVAVIANATAYRSDRGTPVAWLYGIARNVVAQHQRSSARERAATSRIVGRRLLGPDAFAAAEQRIDAERESRALYLAMSSLPADERAVLELTALDGLSVADAAAALGVKPVTARVRLHRGRRALQATLRAPHDPTAELALPTEVMP